MIDSQRPDLAPLGTPTPTPAPESLAHRYEQGEEDLAYTSETETVEYERRICGHSGNCPCAGQDTTVKVETLQFADGSIYVEELDRAFKSDGEMHDAVAEHDAERDRRDDHHSF